MALLETAINAVAAIATELVTTRFSFQDLFLYGAVTVLVVEAYRRYIAVDNRKK